MEEIKEPIGQGNISVVSEAKDRYKPEKNEDRYLILPINGGVCLSVIDGVGGQNEGGAAAQCLADVVKQGMMDNSSFEDIQRNASGMIKEKTGGRSSGATYVAAVIRNSKLTTYQAGDCRCIVVRDGSVLFATRDESVMNRVENVVTGHNHGKTTKSHEITLQKDDIVILTSDGITDNLLEQSYFDFEDEYHHRRTVVSRAYEALSMRQDEENKKLAQLTDRKSADAVVNNIINQVRINKHDQSGFKHDDRTLLVYVHQ